MEALPATAAPPDWPGGDKFVAVQDLLDKNAVLIAQINENHSTRNPEALQRNVLLIRELNSNVQQVVELYQELAGVLTGAQQQPPGTAAAGATGAAGAGGGAPPAAAAAGQKAP